MSGSLVIGCGGSGVRVVSSLEAASRTCLTINWGNGADIDISLAVPPGSDRLDPAVVRAAFDASRDRITSAMSGFGEVVLVVSPGGTVANASLECISAYARESGLRFVGLVTVPFGFEDERRAEVLANLPFYAGLCDRMFVIDLQYSGELTKLKAFSALEAVDGLTSTVALLLSGLLGSIPFYSTFVSKVYSLSRGHSDNILESYEEAHANPRFSPDLVGNRIVICTDAPMDDQLSEALQSHVTNKTGSVPDMIIGKGEGNGITVFVPISLRTE